MGRPSSYSQEMAEAICARLAQGEPLSAICDSEAMPGLSTVYQWLAAFPSFAELYARAREDQADTMADQIVKIADEKDEDPQRQRLRVDARKWAASKLKPKKYGERIEHGGEIVHRHSLADILRAIPDCEDPPVEAGGAS